MCRRLLLCCMVLLFAGLWVLDCYAQQAQGKAAIYFSQGQAVDNPQDRARSKSDAIRDFLTQAVTQAVASLLSPSQMGSKFGSLQEKILKQPERYVENHQVFTEGASDGLYRVRGQVTVAMEALKKDLRDSGFAPAESGRSEPASKTAGQASLSEERNPFASADREQGIKPSQPASRGMSVSTREFVWAVAEKWEQGWYLPQDRRDPRAIFALSVVQESQGYGWSLRLPPAGAVSVDNTGNVSTGDVLSLARRLGISKIVLGTVASRQAQNQKALLSLSVRVLDTSSSRLEGEIHKELPMDGLSYQEGAMDLAGLVVPQLDRLLRESAPQSREPSQPAGSVQRSTPVQSTGEWTVTIKGDHQYASWEELEKMLQVQFKSMSVKGLELGSDTTKIRIDGIDGQYLRTLQGTTLGSGAQVQVTGFSPEARSINLTLSRQ